MTTAELALALFALCNSVRVLAYVPQIVKVARDANGASAISYTTWGLFAASHLSTVAYAILTLQDWRMAAVFGANTVCCAVILALTAVKRARFERNAADREPAQSHRANSEVPWAGTLRPSQPPKVLRARSRAGDRLAYARAASFDAEHGTRRLESAGLGASTEPTLSPCAGRIGSAIFRQIGAGVPRPQGPDL